MMRWRVGSGDVRRAARVCGAALLLAGLTACSSATSDGAAPDGQPSEITADEAPETATFVHSAHGGAVAFASPVIWDQDGIDESWVGLFRTGDAGITVLPDLPLEEPFSFPAVQVTDDAVLLLGTECPEPEEGSMAELEGATCGSGAEPFALSYDLVSKQWSPFTPPPLPDGQRLGIGMVEGAPAFGVLTATGPGSSAELVAYTQGSDGATWVELPPPPLADIADVCVTDQGLVAVETSQFEGFINAGHKTFEEMEEERLLLETLDDGSIYAARYDSGTRAWTKSKVTGNRMVGTVACQEPGIVYVRGNTSLVVQPALPAASTTFTATREIGPEPSAVEVDGELVATYWWHEDGDAGVEQSTATADRVSAPVPLDDTAFPSASFSLGDDAYWAGLDDHQLQLSPITPS